MRYEKKARNELISEIKELRKMIAKLEALEAEHKQVEEEQRERVKLYRTVLQKLPDIVYKIDPDGHFTFISNSVRILGYEPEELIGKHFSKIIHPDDVKSFSRVIALPKHKGKATGDENRPKLFDERRTGKRKTKDLGVRLIPKNFGSKEKEKIGAVITFGNVSATGFYEADIHEKYKKFLGTLGIIRDITDRKRAEEALRESEERYRTIFETTGTAMLIIEEDMTISLANTEFENLSFYSREEIEGKKSWTEFVVKEDLEKMKKYHRLRRVDKNLAPKRYEFSFIDRESNIKNIILHISIIPGTKKSLASLLDITEQKKLEQQFRHSQKMEAIGRLAGGIAHEFNNMLMAMEGYSDLLYNGLSEQDPLRKHVEKIKKVMERSTLLSKQLLAFSHKHILKLKILNLNILVTEIEKMLRLIIGEDIELFTVLEPELECVKVDPGHIEQVIMNLATNARDAMLNDGKLTIETKNVTLNEDDCLFIEGSKPGRFVCLSIKDTGVGMEKKIIQHIFEPFFSTKERERGTGLGLSTVYGIIKQHEGWINVYSEPGKGTTFNIYLSAISLQPDKESKKTKPRSSK
ncbi:MAG: PAS domain S-box protein [Candidatus Cloacimonadota bacterium]|nr:MAG: PAS domain S-box protein [Candidatus Cloacimonadota bacterium]